MQLRQHIMIKNEIPVKIRYESKDRELKAYAYKYDMSLSLKSNVERFLCQIKEDIFSVINGTQYKMMTKDGENLNEKSKEELI